MYVGFLMILSVLSVISFHPVRTYTSMRAKINEAFLRKLIKNYKVVTFYPYKISKRILIKHQNLLVQKVSTKMLSKNVASKRNLFKNKFRQVKILARS